MNHLVPALLALVALPPLQDPVPAAEPPIPEEDGALVGSLNIPAEDEVMMLRLRSGEIHWGAIPADAHDPDGFRFALLAHGGTVELTWEMLDPSQELALRTRYGYIDVSTEELMVDAETLVLVDGRELTGVILSRDGDNFVLKHEGSLQMVPKVRVQNTISGQRLPALDVYSREELYTMHAGKAADDDPQDQLELAKLCEQILDFQHAVEHYEAVLVLDPDTDRKDVEFALERALEKAAQQAQIDYLRECDHLRKRKKYDEALARLEAFSETFVDSPLAKDALQARDRILVARDDALRDLVRRRWLDHTRKYARTAAKTFGYEAAIGYCEEQYSQDVLAAVTEDVKRSISEDVEEDDVLAYWATRKKVRFYNANYGEGTWMLGEERALAGTGDKSEEKKAVNEADAQRQALEEKIEKFLKNQKSARSRKTSAEQADEYAVFWSQFSIDDRAQWIRAYYVEFSGDFELRDHPYLRNCPTCAGRGAHEIVNAGAGTSAGRNSGGRGGGRGGRGNAAPSNGLVLVACPTCRGIGRSRRVYYR